MVKGLSDLRALKVYLKVASRLNFAVKTWNLSDWGLSSNESDFWDGFILIRNTLRSLSFRIICNGNK